MSVPKLYGTVALNHTSLLCLGEDDNHGQIIWVFQLDFKSETGNNHGNRNAAPCFPLPSLSFFSTAPLLPDTHCILFNPLSISQEHKLQEGKDLSLFFIHCSVRETRIDSGI